MIGMVSRQAVMVQVTEDVCPRSLFGIVPADSELKDQAITAAARRTRRIDASGGGCQIDTAPGFDRGFAAQPISEIYRFFVGKVPDLLKSFPGESRTGASQDCSS